MSERVPEAVTKAIAWLDRYVHKSDPPDSVAEAIDTIGEWIALIGYEPVLNEPQAEHDRLRWGVVANAGHDSSERMFRWAHVKRNTGLGMTSSIALCREAGFDPDEIVGNEESEEVCDALILQASRPRSATSAASMEALFSSPENTIPTSASAKAGASFSPSPIIPTNCPSF